MVPEEDYLAALAVCRGSSPECEKPRYDAGKRVALALNNFSLQLQNRIYELYGLGEAPGFTHATLGDYYHRVTANEFAQMMTRAELRDCVVRDAKKLVDEVSELAKCQDVAALHIYKRCEGDLQTVLSEALWGNGFTLFSALFRIAEVAAGAVAL